MIFFEVHWIVKQIYESLALRYFSIFFNGLEGVIINRLLKGSY